MIESNGDLHVLVLRVSVTVPQQHDLVMMRHVIVGNGYSRGAMNGINEAVAAVGEGAMVNPDMAPPENGNPVPIGQSPPTVMARRISNISIPALLAVMDV